MVVKAWFVLEKDIYSTKTRGFVYTCRVFFGGGGGQVGTTKASLLSLKPPSFCSASSQKAGIV